jgi:spore photoproduct lyase
MAANMSWKDPSRFINRLFVEESCLELDYTKEILARAKLPWSVIQERQKPNDFGESFAANLSKGKRQLFLCKNRGHFFKPCPGTREYQCCRYQVVNTGTNCPIDCVYCILQAYLNTPCLTFHVNVDQLFHELSESLTANPQKFFRIGTGEFTDSLAIDRLTCLSHKMVEFFGRTDNAVLELKTKSAAVNNLQGLPHNGKTIVAWSLNSTQIMAKYEIRSATLEERLESAKRCAEWGYRLAFHFDPIIDHPGWEVGYAETIDRLFSKVPASAISWISMGALRFLPNLKEIAFRRFPETRIYFQEFITGLDGKARYFRPSRVRLYRYIHDLLQKKVSEKTCVYFCMESDEIWREVMGYIPSARGGLATMLDAAVS